ncbi:MAG: hypothetical protein PVH19_15615, partial [Planctomycetia bacterium]
MGTDTDTDVDADADTDADADADTDADTDSDTPSTEDTESEVNTSTDSDTETPLEFQDVCSFEEMVELGEPDAAGMVLVPPNHPDILYFGRVDCADPSAPTFAYPGVSIRIKFNGTDIDMEMTDRGTAEQPNFYNIIVDDTDPQVLELIPGRNTYILAENLSSDTHTVEIFKRIESNSNKG